MANPEVEIKYGESYNESTSNITTATDLIFRYTSAQTLSQVQSDVVSWCRTHRRDFGGRGLSNVTINQDESSLGDVWSVHVEWSSKPVNQQQQNQQYPQEPGVDPAESFTAVGGTAHISTAFYETAYPVTQGVPAPPMYCGIGWDGDRFSGVDVVRPTFEFSLTHKYNYSDLTPTIRNSWLSLVGSVNSDTFWSFSPGEVLYVGFSGSSSTEYDGTTTVIDGQTYQAAQNYYTITHNFRCSPNAVMDVAGVQVNKNGWDYVWVLRQKSDDPNTGQTLEVPIGVYVNQVYPYAAFNGVF